MVMLRQDLRGALRYFRRNHGFVVAAVLILGFGIGTATAVFSITETLVLRSLAYPDSERLVALRCARPLSAISFSRASGGTLADWQLNATSFEAIAGYRWHTLDLIDGQQSARLNGLLVTPEFFEVFGVSLNGRPFLAEDQGSSTVVLGNEVWRRLFHADEARVGGMLDLNVRNLSRVGPTRFTVLGVATAPIRFPPLEADFELGVATVADTIDFWLPQFVVPTESRGYEGLLFNVVAKLRPEVTITQAQAEMDAISRRQAEEYPRAYRGWNVRVIPLREQVTPISRDGIALLSLGAGLLLLIACANVAALFLARGIARHREVAIRAALGAARWQIVRQLLIESAVLATGAGAVGVAFAAWAIELARPWLPQSLPALQGMAVNPAVLLFAVISAVLTACITGVAPAIRAARPQGAGLAGRDARGMTSDRSRTRLTGVLISAEVALTVVLVVGAGLLVRSALLVSQVEPGFNPSNLLTMTVSLPENKFDWGHNAVFARDVINEVRALPAVTHAAVVQGVPMSAGGFLGWASIEGYVPPADAGEPVYGIRVVSPEYLETMQIPIVAGRGFDARDEVGKRGYPRSVLVSDSFAQRYWPGQDPLGKRIGSPEWWMTVVGVAGDVRYTGLESAPTIDVYYPQRLFPQAAITLVARTMGDPLNEVAEVRERIHGVDQHAFISDIRTMDQLIAGSQAERQAGTLLVSVFGTLALVLVVSGVYSVIAQAVVQRELEFAIRAALGATPRRVIAVAMGTVLPPAVAGVALGALGALGVTRFMTSLLFGVEGFDNLTCVGTAAMILTACVTAGYLPARRATQIDLMKALRAEY